MVTKFLNMVRSLLCCLLLFLNLPSEAQNQYSDTSCTAVAYWSAGDVMQYAVRTTKMNSARAGKAGGSNYEVEVKVLSESATGYQLSWHISNLELFGEGTDNPMVQKLGRLVEGSTFIYTTDELGIFKELVNKSEVVSMMDKVLDELAAAASEDEQTLVAIEMIRPSLTRPEFLDNAMKDIRLFHTVFGYEYITDKALMGEIQLENMLGGPVIPATVVSEITSLEPVANRCEIKVETSIDSKEGIDAIRQTVNMLAEQTGGEKVGATELPPMDIKDENDFTIEISSGWILKAASTRNVKTPSTELNETMVITRK